MAGYTGGGGGGGGGAPTDAQYVTLATDGGLANERVLTAGTGISLTDGGAGGNLTIANTVAAGAPPAADYVTLSTDGGLSNERVLTAGTGISLTDGGAGGNLTIANTVAAGAPSAAQYVTLATDGGLANERVLTAGTGISLTDGGAGGNLTIAATASGGGGKVLQIVHAAFNGLFTTSSTSYVDVAAGGNTLQATITPSAATSTILIQVSINTSQTNGGSSLFRVFDGSAAVAGGVKDAAQANQESGVLHVASSVSTPHGYAVPFGYAVVVKDSPATTSAITYTVEAKCTAAIDPVYVNRNSRNGNYIQDSPGTSTITLFEIGV
jgi:hypothetical protein